MYKFLLLMLLIFISNAQADEYVNGYTRRNGTYVDSYHRSTADNNPYNNYSTRGNINPYTGEAGTRSVPSYGSYEYTAIKSSRDDLNYTGKFNN